MARRQIVAAVVLAGVALAAGAGSMVTRERARVRTDNLARARQALDRRDLAGAAALLDATLARAPNDNDAAFARAEVAVRAGDYNTARTMYLAATGAAALAADARARLFDMTLAVGARDEATHHLDKLETLVGAADARVSERRARLAMPPPAPR